MSKIFNLSALVLFSAATLFTMYRETPAKVRPAVADPKPKAVQTRDAAPEIAYTISMSKPWTHLLEVEMRMKWPSARQTVDVKMPVWTPGSYLIREYARHVQDFAAKSGTSPLAWSKINKNTWRVNADGAKEIVLNYRVYSNELTVRTNELNDEHAFWNNGATLMFPAGQLAAPSTVTVQPFNNWKVATGLPKVAGQANTFSAKNFDILYDSPFEVSDFTEITFSVHGKPHRVVMSGEGNYDLRQIATDIAKIVEEGYKIFGELPYDDYTFIVNLRGGGGLEHLNSTALQWSRWGFRPQARYNGFLSLVAHEYFHLWNVKRIRPDALGPFDYENENYTKLLWVAEGMTSYYETVLKRRAGLISDDAFLNVKASMIEQLQARPGRFETSLEEASMDAWIKYYRQDENSVNNQISYYDKGDIVSMMLDITIRTASNGTKSTDDVLRYLYNEFYKKGRNYTPQDFQKAAELAAGKSLDDFFTKYVRGEAEIDYNGIVRGIGLTMNVTEPNRSRAYLGADLAETDGRLTIRSVTAGTPAYEQGLNTGDQIVAIDGYRATQTFLQSYIGDKKPNDKVKLTIFRFDKLRDVNFTLGSDQRKDYSFAPVENPTAEQQRLYKGYLNADL
ncbi:MAG: M61 family metallopeptidase [Acidobacteria bacterium]|nr:M61 family metallopeptidase [Acidobacteriota bacterium]